MNIALVGFGNIGSYFYKFLKNNKLNLSSKTGIVPHINYISARSKSKKRNIRIPSKLWVKNCNDLTKKKDVDLIIELIGGSDGPAKKLVFEALKNKKHVITANKALVAKYGNELSKIAEKNKVNFEYEAAVCGGIPIIRTIKEGLIANNIFKIYGILNGTSNFILSSMDKEKLDYNQALHKAKKLGYAESNPSSDLNGSDVASKLNILSSLAFNTFIDNKNIYVEGINSIDKNDINNANLLGYKIKLLGVAEKIKDKITQRVHPSLIKNSSYVAKIDGVLNAVIADSYPVGQSVLQGEGAGPGPTASALISDLCSILRGNIKFPFVLSSSQRKRANFNLIGNTNFSVYLRLDVKDKHGVLSDITKIMARHKVSIKRLIQKPFRKKNYASIIIISHLAKDTSLRKMLIDLNKKKYFVKKPKLIRIENI